jgi:hypothetical protein
MSWKVASPDRSIVLDLNVADGPLNGSLTWDGKVFNVSGSWAASGVDKRNASAFAVSGQIPGDKPIYVGATGIMTGSADAATQIKIQVDASSSVDGTINHYEGVLLPA